LNPVERGNGRAVEGRAKKLAIQAEELRKKVRADDYEMKDWNAQQIGREPPNKVSETPEVPD
jgi:hypothetical protein